MNDLMTLDDITEMLRLSRYHVRDVVVKTPGFPPPAPGTGPRKLFLRPRLHQHQRVPSMSVSRLCHCSIFADARSE